MKSILAALALVIGSCLMFAVFHMRPYNLHEGDSRERLLLCSARRARTSRET